MRSKMCKIVLYFTFLAACISLSGCRKKCETTANNILETKMYITPNIPRIQLGDTLRLLLQIKFQNNRLNDGRPVNVKTSSLSTSGIDFVTYRKDNDKVIIDGNNFKIIPFKGSYTIYNNVMIRASYLKTNDAFEFEAYIIPTQKGLANFANYRAEGWMNGKCILNDFSPLVGSLENNHQLLRDFYGPGSDSYIPQNNYYVWVE